MNGSTFAVPAPGTAGLTFKLNSDDLGLADTIKPGFDVLFTGTGVTAPAAGSPDSIVWAASIYPPNPPPDSVKFEGIDVTINSITGTLTTVLSAISPITNRRNAAGTVEMGAILLQGTGMAAMPTLADQLQFGTSLIALPVSVDLSTVQLVALEPIPPIPPANVAAFVTPRVSGRCGQWREEGKQVTVDAHLTGVRPGIDTVRWIQFGVLWVSAANPAVTQLLAFTAFGSSCTFMLPSQLGRVTVSLSVHVDTALFPEAVFRAPSVSFDMASLGAVQRCEAILGVLHAVREIPERYGMGDPGPVEFENVVTEASQAEQLANLHASAQQLVTASTALEHIVAKSIAALREA